MGDYWVYVKIKLSSSFLYDLIFRTLLYKEIYLCFDQIMSI